MVKPLTAMQPPIAEFYCYSDLSIFDLKLNQ